MFDTQIPLNDPFGLDNAIDTLSACLRSGWVSSAGPDIASFEQAVSQITGAPYAIAVASGTAALHLAFLGLGFDQGCEVIVPAVTFAASVNPVLYVGAQPLFIDVDPLTLHLDLDQLEQFLTKNCFLKDNQLINKRTNRIIRAVLAVHLYGNLVDIARLSALCEKFNLLLIEDAAEALGVYDQNRRHAGTFGQIGIISFNGNKIITTGQGGVVLTACPQLADKIRHLSTQAKVDNLRYIHDQIGYNYRLANLNAALGLAQIQIFSDILERKKSIHRRYVAAFSGSRIKILDSSMISEPSHWMNIIDLSHSGVGSWEEVHTALKVRGIATRPIWHPLHLLPPYRNFETIGGENSAFAYRYGLCLPSSAGLSDQEIDRVIAAIFSVAG